MYAGMVGSVRGLVHQPLFGQDNANYVLSQVLLPARRTRARRGRGPASCRTSIRSPDPQFTLPLLRLPVTRHQSDRLLIPHIDSALMNKHFKIARIHHVVFIQIKLFQIDSSLNRFSQASELLSIAEQIAR